ncbi:PDZ domain-containing protein [Helicobacter marmotae]|uniref:PDZ domain-containing protein n=1 Tax=Helicobacter marmotae TaxID=152490 RepID=A0A3D8I149_9HELI|nr:PDZ domain-containing protein [Helicobacter marmotae]RDU58860.1 PDZ domain-containing protein [Helicobacter marmotae]
MTKSALLKSFLLLFYSTHLWAYDYSHCVQYFKAASTPVGQSHAISLKDGIQQHHLLYSPTKPQNVKILKADPFIGLYLISLPRTKQSYDLLPLDKRTLEDKNLAFIAPGGKVQVGHITKRQNGFIEYARFSAPTQANGILGNICYQIYGIGTGGNGFIEQKYIDRFLKQKSPYYGDLGIRFSSSHTQAIISIIDPFDSNHAFRFNDEILAINGIKIKNRGEAEWVISNLKKGSNAKILIKRNGKTLSINAKVSQRYGGFLLKESFLERFGIELDDNMRIHAINPALAGRFSELRKGDTILWINKEPIITSSTHSAFERFQRLKTLLSQAQFDQRFGGKIQLLIMRDNLEIFIKV